MSVFMSRKKKLQMEQEERERKITLALGERYQKARKHMLDKVYNRKGICVYIHGKGIDPSSEYFMYTDDELIHFYKILRATDLSAPREFYLKELDKASICLRKEDFTCFQDPESGILEAPRPYKGYEGLMTYTVPKTEFCLVKKDDENETYRITLKKQCVDSGAIADLISLHTKNYFQIIDIPREFYSVEVQAENEFLPRGRYLAFREKQNLYLVCSYSRKSVQETIPIAVIPLNDIYYYKSEGTLTYTPHVYSSGGDGGVGGALLGGWMFGAAGAVIGSELTRNPVTVSSYNVKHDTRVLTFEVFKNGKNYTIPFSYTTEKVWDLLIPEKQYHYVMHQRRLMLDANEKPEARIEQKATAQEQTKTPIQKIRETNTAKDAAEPKACDNPPAAPETVINLKNVYPALLKEKPEKARHGKRTALAIAVSMLVMVLTATCFYFASPKFKDQILDWINAEKEQETTIVSVEREEEKEDTAYTDSKTVSYVQERLQNIGYPEVSADGSLGPVTRAAIMDFQELHAVEETGIITDALLDMLQKDTEEPLSLSEQMMAWYTAFTKSVQEKNYTKYIRNGENEGTELWDQFANMAVARFETTCLEQYENDQFVVSKLYDSNGVLMNTFRCFLSYVDGEYIIDVDTQRLENELAWYGCQVCGGTGQTYSGGFACGSCGGTGQIYNPSQWYDGLNNLWVGGFEACSACGGAGYTGGHWDLCSACGGWGLIQ